MVDAEKNYNPLTWFPILHGDGQGEPGYDREPLYNLTQRCTPTAVRIEECQVPDALGTMWLLDYVGL